MKVSNKEGTIAVSRTVYKGDFTNRIEKIEIRPFVTSTASVSIKYSARAPFGVKGVDVMITVPCYKEEIIDVFKETKALVSDLMQKEVEELCIDV